MAERPAATGRGVELALLVFAAGLVTLALVLVEADQRQQLSRSLLYLGVVYLGLFAVAHAAVRWLAPHADPLILPCVALLNGLGLVMIHRLDLAAATQALDTGGPGDRGCRSPGGVDRGGPGVVRGGVVVGP